MERSRDKFEINFPHGSNWQPQSPANYIRERWMQRILRQELPANLRLRKTVQNKIIKRGRTKNSERAKEIQKAQAAAAAAPKTPANHAFEEVLRQKKAELERLREEARPEQERRKQERREQARQKQIRNEQERQERWRQQYAQQKNLEEEDVAFADEAQSPAIRQKQAEIYALEHADPVNPTKLDLAKAELAVIESEEMLEFVETEYPKVFETYGAGHPMVSEMNAALSNAIARFDEATRELGVARSKLVGGYTRKRKRKRT